MTFVIFYHTLTKYSVQYISAGKWYNKNSKFHMYHNTHCRRFANQVLNASEEFYPTSKFIVALRAAIC